MSTLQLRYKDGLLPFSVALVYGVFGYAFALIILTVNSGFAAHLIGMLLLAHTMVICAYLIHECAHNTVFAANAHNARLGAALGWITGSCYARYEGLRRKHFRHHVERADIVALDYRRRLSTHPLAATVIAAMEWAYVPAVEIVQHAMVIVLPFMDNHYKPLRTRVALIAAIRAMMFASLAAVSPGGLVLYGCAYLLFLTVLRFMDANQHTYELIETRDRGPSPAAALRNRDYEFGHTFSNPISMHRPWLNLFTLNFAYHNAHHERPTVPWYRLPALHDELYSNDRSHVLAFRNLLRAYHRNRVVRAFRPLGTRRGNVTESGPDLSGIDGISFLIPL